MLRPKGGGSGEVWGSGSDPGGGRGAGGGAAPGRNTAYAWQSLDLVYGPTWQYTNHGAGRIKVAPQPQGQVLPG